MRTFHKKNGFKAVCDLCKGAETTLNQPIRSNEALICAACKIKIGGTDRDVARVGLELVEQKKTNGDS